MTLFDVTAPIVSDDLVVGPYRYWLSRDWDPTLPRICWSMLNPSDATRDRRDPTDKKVEKFTRAWGYGGYTIVNLAALQASDPDELAKVDNPRGPDNMHHFCAAVDAADLVIAAWGASYPKSLAEDAAQTGQWMSVAGAYVLGLTKNGDPRHPLYMLDSSTPIRWSTS